MSQEAIPMLQIVLIEDNPSDVYLTRLALEEHGLIFEITNYQSGAEALPILCPIIQGPEGEAVPDLILLDLNTPASDGFEVLKRIRSSARLAHVPVAVVTSSSYDADQHRAMLMGATKYIQKPTQLAAFIDCIGTAVKQMVGSKVR